MQPKPKIQILDVTYESGQEAMDNVRKNLSTIEEIAQRHGVRSLLISPYLGDADPYDAFFAIRMNDDTYGAGKFAEFSLEVEDATGINAHSMVHSPDNSYIKMLRLNKPYHDELGEEAVTQAEIHKQSGFRRQAGNGGSELG